ncbi:type III pantothenate kinase, partial [Micromonospora sp. WP24]
MLLCIDIGNTNTVLATFDGDKLVHSWRIKTDARSTADELGLMFRGLLAGD